MCKKRKKAVGKMKRWMLNHKLVYPDCSLPDYPCEAPDHTRPSSVLFMLNVAIPITLWQEDVDSIMTKALNGGINYWCNEVKILGPCRGKNAAEHISRFGELRLYLTDETSLVDRPILNEHRDMTLDKFLSGIRQYVAERGGVARDETGRIATSEIDAAAADSIIQYALFGEIVYS